MKMNSNLCAIYRSPKKEGMFLYVPQREQFNSVPDELKQIFGKPEFVMLFNLAGEKQLKRVKNAEVLQKLQEQGYFLQMPPVPENLLKTFLENQNTLLSK